ncbi:CBS domain-containing protein CBSX1, chloroplastic [Pyrus x bretschneideri]|uniref:CBS domain-containing protein CBSX1, chloroplastic n=1 Tax=Pyrus x bretschneideri TaxID=225117 RepID=UPI000510EC3F|nr:CBS domain-containing protein CBSX1, chloroplastic [Pyrus x bretschneideri]
MASIFVPQPPLLHLSTPSASAPADRTPCLPLVTRPGQRLFLVSIATLGVRRSFNVASSATFVPNSVPEKNGVLTVGDFMTRREDLHVVKPTTTVDEAIELLVENRITGFPVIDDDWTLVGLVSDYDLLALDTISGSGRTDNSMFPEVDSTWKTFNEVQKLLSKTNGQVVGDVMTPAPVVVSETTNLEGVARMLLETKYRRLPVVNESGKLIGIITRGNIIRAALQMKHASESKT